jgi:hypothetical protein
VQTEDTPGPIHVKLGNGSQTVAMQGSQQIPEQAVIGLHKQVSTRKVPMKNLCGGIEHIKKSSLQGSSVTEPKFELANLTHVAEESSPLVHPFHPFRPTWTAILILRCRVLENVGCDTFGY